MQSKSSDDDLFKVPSPQPLGASPLLPGIPVRQREELSLNVALPTRSGGLASPTREMAATPTDQMFALDWDPNRAKNKKIKTVSTRKNKKRSVPDTPSRSPAKMRASQDRIQDRVHRLGPSAAPRTPQLPTLLDSDDEEKQRPFFRSAYTPSTHQTVISPQAERAVPRSAVKIRPPSPTVNIYASPHDLSPRTQHDQIKSHKRFASSGKHSSNYYTWMMSEQAPTGGRGYSDSDMIQSRLTHDFSTLHQNVALGSFSSNQQCQHRLDGCIYSIKVIKRHIVSESQMQHDLREAHVLASLRSHPNILRYYNAWIEDQQLHIQTEFCDGGSLQHRLGSGVNDDMGTRYIFHEDELISLLVQMARALAHVHGHNLAHLDIKPANILIAKNGVLKSSTLLPKTQLISPTTNDKAVSSSSSSSSSSVGSKVSFSDDVAATADDDDDESEEVTLLEYVAGTTVYKLGDFGLAHLIKPITRQGIEAKFELHKVDDGDTIYLPIEILKDDYEDLSKADIFSLALTIYRVALNAPLPSSGYGWQELRSGRLTRLDGMSDFLHDVLTSMIQEDKHARPSAQQLLTTLLTHERQKRLHNQQQNTGQMFNAVTVSGVDSLETECLLRDEVIRLEQEVARLKPNHTAEK